MKKLVEGDTLADEEGKEGFDVGKKYSRQSQAERWGRQDYADDYKKTKRLHDALPQPARGIRKGVDWIKEKAADVRDGVRGVLVGDAEEAEYSKGRKAIRQRELGYKKGGSVKSSASRRADGIASRGKTKGRMI
jgi:hypothetical protein